MSHEATCCLFNKQPYIGIFTCCEHLLNVQFLIFVVNLQCFRRCPSFICGLVC